MKRISLFNQRGIRMFISSLFTFCFAWVYQGQAQIQPTDLQWYIWNGKGRNGTTQPGNLYSNPIGTTFLLENVTNPNRACNPKAKNELLIICDDSTYVNSREEYNNTSQAYDIDLFYPDDTALLPVDSQYYQSVKNKAIKYLYMTSKYEEDDPPIGLKASTPRIPPPNTSVYDFEKTKPTAFLSANHDVIPNKDITLIVAYDSLTKAFPKNKFYIQWDTVKPLGNNPPILNRTLFNPEKTFDGQASFPANSMVISNLTGMQGRLVDLGQKFQFINLRPTPNLDACYPSSDTPRYHAQFVLYRDSILSINAKGDTIQANNLKHVYTLSEAILSSHDPNLVRRDTICNKDGETYIHYHVEFTNTTFQPAGNLKVEMTFPEDFAPGCIDTPIWILGGETVNGTIRLQGSKIEFAFPPELTVISCVEGGDPSACKGSIDFCIRTETDRTNLTSLTHSIKPETVVYFDDVGYPLDHFIDPHKTTVEGSAIRMERTGFDESCECDCHYFCMLSLPCMPRTTAYIIAGSILATVAAMLASRFRKRTQKIISNEIDPLKNKKNPTL